MKRLYLLRHATALPSAGSDKERKLSPEGLIEAAALGVEMMRRNYQPDYILCSPAIRTRETFGQLPFEKQPHVFPERLYNASARDLLAHVHGLEDKIQSALVVAHNPGIYELAASLAHQGEKNLMNRMLGGFRPCSMAVVGCPVKSWKEISFQGGNELKDFLESGGF